MPNGWSLQYILKMSSGSLLCNYNEIIFIYFSLRMKLFKWHVLFFLWRMSEMASRMRWQKSRIWKMNCSQKQFYYEVDVTQKIGVFTNNLIRTLTILLKTSPKNTCRALCMAWYCIEPKPGLISMLQTPNYLYSR